MLESLHLKNVGPAPEMTMELAPRLNLITGDNGLGKTLLLDSSWWALTRTWPVTWGGKGAVPEKEDAEIAWRERRGNVTVVTNSEYDFDGSVWKAAEPMQGPHPDRREGGLVVYLRVDGGISIHDPLRAGEHVYLPGRRRTWGQSHSLQFRDVDIWNGLALDDAGNGNGSSSLVCEGLVRDLVRWAVEPDSVEFDRIANLVEQLAGEESFRLTRKVARVYVDDARDFPFIDGPAGDLPVVHAPAGLRRILGLAYLVVWAWREHKVAAGLKKREPDTSLVLLIDEVESHLHPKWQRTILPSLLRALGKDVQLQVIATTHSPLVLASMEPSFDLDQDAWFDLDIDNEAPQPTVTLKARPYVRHGEVGNWLASEAFDLKEPRSLEGERAVRAAQDVLSAAYPTLAQIDAADKQLREAGLPDIDPFWVRWGYFVEQAKKASAPERTS
jgi:hypothetical protein